jgi:signal transduction histidine kinase
VERARIARELHDVVAHAVSIMVVQAAAADEVLDRDPQRAHVALGAVQRSGRAAVVELGRMLDLLRSDDEALAPLPTLEGLPALVADARRSGLDVALHDETPGRYPAAIELCAYRVVQEGVTNALRHAPGSRVAVRLAQCGDALEVWVENSAAAVPSPAPAGTGHGLIGLRERVTVFGGRLDAGPRPEGGYRVRASVPLGAVP